MVLAHVRKGLHTFGNQSVRSEVSYVGNKGDARGRETQEKITGFFLVQEGKTGLFFHFSKYRI